MLARHCCAIIKFFLTTHDMLSKLVESIWHVFVCVTCTIHIATDHFHCACHALIYIHGALILFHFIHQYISLSSYNHHSFLSL